MARWLSKAAKLVVCGALVVPVLALTACGGGGSSNASAKSSGGSSSTQAAAATPTPGPIAKVQISDNKFEPAELTVKAGTTVEWDWSGSNPHSVVLNGVDSGKHTGSGTYTQTFTTGGVVYNYQCGVHGSAMTGKITVE